MVDFAIMKVNKPIATPNFYFISPFVWQRSPLRQFFGRKSSPKITLFRRAFTAILKAIPWYLDGIFSLAIFAGHASAIFLEPVSLTVKFRL